MRGIPNKSKSKENIQKSEVQNDKNCSDHTPPDLERPFKLRRVRQKKARSYSEFGVPPQVVPNGVGAKFDLKNYPIWFSLVLSEKVEVGVMNFSKDKDVIDEHNVFDKMSQPGLGICSRYGACLITPRPLPKPPPSQWHLENARKALSRSSSLIQWLHLDTHLLYETTNDVKEYEKAFTFKNSIVDPVKEKYKKQKISTVYAQIFDAESWMEKLGNKKHKCLFILIIREMKLILVQARKPNEIKNVAKMCEQRTKEIDVMITATRLVWHKSESYHLGNDGVEIGQRGGAIQGITNESIELQAIRDLVLRKVGENNMVNADGIYTRLRASIFKQIDHDCEFMELKDMEWILASRKSPMLTFGKILDPELTIQHILHCVKEWSSNSSQHVRSAWPYITMGMAPLIGIDLLSQSLLPAVVELTEDRHWRVRLVFIEYIPLLASRGVGFFNDKLGALCMHWLQDKVYSIREVAANNLKGLAEEFGPEWAMQHIVPQVLNMLTNPHCLYLITILQKILLLAMVMGSEITCSNLVGGKAEKYVKKKLSTVDSRGRESEKEGVML
ncbi:protein phosphatase 2A subunit A3 [Perilla frutescens var. hirtella]|uniref:Protein phosphatase 2A subunit A3 n=1 Tax=Perilla frutescens var. hirtella TaxID=608512 RepID=A0AAD4ISX0_PERFH|nr:protein phosphatase 2A subunit A3 [Perilla frutescens var. hirtella]